MNREHTTRGIYRICRLLSVISVYFVCSVVSLLALSCARPAGLPQPGSNQYRELVSAFYVGLAGLQTGEDVRAREKLMRATEIAPGEPAAWANLGLLSVRQQEFDAAYEMVERARSLAPGDSRIESLLGLIESRRGRLPEAIAHFEKAVSLDAGNLKALYALAQEVERQSDENADLGAQRRLEQILALDSDNIAVLVDLARIAAKRNDVETLKKAAARLLENSGGWPEEARRQLAVLRETSDADVRAASTSIAYLRNTLLRVPAYRKSLNDVKTPPEFISDPFLKFLKLPSPSSFPAAHDGELSFESQPLPDAPAGGWEWIGAVPLNDEGRLSLLLANHNELQIAGGARLPFPGAMGSPPLGPNAVLGVDLDYDFKTDLVLAGAAGVLIYKQETAGRFIDVTDRAKLPASVTRAAYVGAWAIDIDLDGDLDVLLGAANGAPVVLRNNGDGTFNDLRPFAGVTDLRAFAAADIDGDGDPDAALLDARGNLSIFLNERLGEYRPGRTAQHLSGIRAIASADLDRDGIADFAALDRSGKLFTVSEAGASVELASGIPASNESADPSVMFVADFDNNGGLDLIVAAAGVYLSDEKNAFRETVGPLDAQRIAIMDINDDGRLDIVGLRDGGVVQFINRGAKNYHHQKIRTRAAKSTGDQRINSFGIGGEIEIRAGLLTQKQIISSPVLHFGLGDMTEVDVARIVWPNGSVQAEFELRADESILAEQRLKGSCPMLFAWDGRQISYVKDAAPWSPALGLHINAQVVAGIYQTQEWFRIRGDQLAPRDGYYDLRVTAELWETYYLDHYSLMVVDHPEGSEVFADERFAVPPPPLRLYAAKKTQPFAHAVDDLGADVTHLIRDLDEKYLDTFGKGRYQGVTRDHWVELQLPVDAPERIYLIGDGFLHPTDGSINIAYGQTSFPPPQGLSIETPDAAGNWKTARSGLGFPAGKRKTIVLDLNGIFRPGAQRRLRLRTNMEIYWDRLKWAEALPDSTYSLERVELSAAELRYRGFSRFTQADDSSPELPDYNVLESTAPRWRDLIGYYTRHGDVRELLEKIDDRMVIVNAGDEVRLRFPALPPQPEGWVRDYIFVGDGWIKDGDLNSTFSKTVLPLPYHGMKDYTTAPRKLEDDPAYRRHPEDWQRYHTRYVTPERFVRALRVEKKEER